MTSHDCHVITATLAVILLILIIRSHYYRVNSMIMVEASNSRRAVREAAPATPRESLVFKIDANTVVIGNIVT